MLVEEFVKSTVIGCKRGLRYPDALLCSRVRVSVDSFPQHQHRIGSVPRVVGNSVRGTCPRDVDAEPALHWISDESGRAVLLRHKGRGRPERLPAADPGSQRAISSPPTRAKRTEMQPEEKKVALVLHRFIRTASSQGSGHLRYSRSSTPTRSAASRLAWSQRSCFECRERCGCRSLFTWQTTHSPGRGPRLS